MHGASNRWTAPQARFTLRGVTDCGEHARCILALEDGTIFFGECFGAEGTQTGEVVFNTSMTGYQEVLTDPSYCGQGA